MDSAREAALRADGDGYHSRNHAGIGTISDPAFAQAELIHSVNPITSVLEIGCTTGFRLEKARQAFGARCAGLEISPAAVTEGRSLYPQVRIEQGAAPRDLSLWEGDSFDLVIVGHFLYLLPREDLFSLAAAVDSLVRAGGHIIVMDFIHHLPVSAPYSHSDDLRVHKMDPSAPWTWSPDYMLVGRSVYEIADPAPRAVDPRAWQTVDVVRKLTIEQAYPEHVPLPSVHAGQGDA